MDDKNKFLDGNVKGLMMDLVGRWNVEMDRLQAATPFAGIRASDQRLFGQLRGRPTPMTDLHKKLGISRQAAHKSVRRLVDHGVVEIVDSPQSNKHKIVVVTERGQQLRKLAAESIRNIEEDCVQRIGRDRLEELRAILKALNE